QHRLYVARNLPSGFYVHISPWLYFHPDVAHLLNRPREIGEILRASPEREIGFSPGPEPTFAFPVIDFIDQGGYRPAAVGRYHVLNSFRPWWASQWYLPPEARPVDLGWAAALLLALAVA